ncbi:MAG: CaiB/BaiF CoA transferase family protein [Flavobacteriales bacterium]
MQPKQIHELKILDLSTVLAGPSVGTFFAELGAHVIKIEHPVFGDVTNSWRLPNEQDLSQQSAYYSSVNFNKQTVKLNLQVPNDYMHFLEALKDTDIVLMNFKKGDDVKLKLDDQTLWKHKPGLIIGKITGFGSDTDRIAYDLILQAETGFMSMNGSPDSEPTKMPVALIDVLAAHQLKEGLLLALLKNSQHGQLVSVSLYDAAVCSLANQAANYLMTGHIPQRIGSLHPNIAPYGEIFQTKDAKQITFAIGSDLHFEKLVHFLGLAELATDPRFSMNIARVKNRAVLFQLLEPIISKKTSSEICTSLIELNVPVAQIKALDEVFTEQTAQNLVRSEQIGTQLTKRVTQIAFKIHDSNT